MIRIHSQVDMDFLPSVYFVPGLFARKRRVPGRRVSGLAERLAVATLTKPLLLAGLLVGLLAFGAPAVVGGGAPDIRGAFDFVASGARDGGAQSASQISSGEFAQVDTGFTIDRLRALAGEPTSRSAAEVEGVELECWYYGIVGATGAYQFCFANGKLRAKLRYGRR
jgi:hypothetical protein